MEAAAERKFFNRGRNAGLAISLLLALFGMTLYSKELQSAVRDSVIYCLTVLTPSLFPFMTVISFAVSSGAAELLSSPLGFIARRLFRLPDCCAVPIILSFIGGYPAGARAVSLLYKAGKITAADAERMACFCFGPGLAFVVSFIGGALLNSVKTGWLLFASVTVSGLIIGLVSGLGKPVPRREKYIRKKERPSLIESVYASSKSVLVMCACVVLFAGFGAILKACGLFELFCRLLSCCGLFSADESKVAASFILEVTGGAGEAAASSAGPVFYAFGLAFGGICVHMQVFAQFAGLRVSRLRFVLLRLAHGVLSAIVCAGLKAVFPAEFAEASALLGGGAAAFSGNALGGLSVVLMSAAFLLYVSSYCGKACNISAAEV